MNRAIQWALVVLLALSVGANIYLARTAFSPRTTGGAVDTALDRKASQMGAADAALLRAALAVHRDQLRQAHRAVRQARADAQGAMGAETVDPQAVDRALADLRRANTALQEVLHRVYGGVAPDMSAEGRAILLARGARAAREAPRRPPAD